MCVDVAFLRRLMRQRVILQRIPAKLLPRMSFPRTCQKRETLILLVGGVVAAEPAAHPPAPPPPPPLAPLGPAVVPAIRHFGGNPSWQVPGGHIVHNLNANSLDAHCACEAHRNPSNPCRLNRTVDSDGRGRANARGRPLGVLCAWLQAGATRANRDLHHKMHNARARQDHDLEDLSVEKRQTARQWLIDNGFHGLLAIERDQRAGEPLEPNDLA